MRLAWFTPWPPDPSGVAGRSSELVALLADRGHALDVFVDETRHAGLRRAGDGAPAPREVRVQPAHHFLWRHHRGQYDLAVYQIGNSRLHEFIWPYVWTVPGLAVLHDVRLHHARGRALLSRGRADAYRAELVWSEPGVPASVAEAAIAGFGGPYLYQWPMTRGVVEAARLVGVHAAGAIPALQACFPGRPFQAIRLGEGRETMLSDERRRACRRRLRVPEDAVVFGVFGGLTPERRLLPVLRAFAAARAHAAEARLLLAGSPDGTVDLDGELRALALDAVVTRTGRLDDDAFDEAIAAADVSLNLRWPSAVEMSGPWLRALAAGVPTVIVDLPHLAAIPSLDPRTWQLHAPALAGRAAADAVAIAVDILDEEHSLRRAMRRLAVDAELRRRIGHTGRTYWEREHRATLMADDYEAAFERALTLPVPRPALPPELVPDPLAHARHLAAPFEAAGVTLLP